MTERHGLEAAGRMAGLDFQTDSLDAWAENKLSRNQGRLFRRRKNYVEPQTDFLNDQTTYLDIKTDIFDTRQVQKVKRPLQTV